MSMPRMSLEPCHDSAPHHAPVSRGAVFVDLPPLDAAPATSAATKRAPARTHSPIRPSPRASTTPSRWPSRPLAAVRPLQEGHPVRSVGRSCRDCHRRHPRGCCASLATSHCTRNRWGYWVAAASGGAQCHHGPASTTTSSAFARLLNFPHRPPQRRAWLPPRGYLHRDCRSRLPPRLPQPRSTPAHRRACRTMPTSPKHRATRSCGVGHIRQRHHHPRPRWYFSHHTHSRWGVHYYAHQPDKQQQNTNVILSALFPTQRRWYARTRNTRQSLGPTRLRDTPFILFNYDTIYFLVPRPFITKGRVHTVFYKLSLQGLCKAAKKQPWRIYCMILCVYGNPPGRNLVALCDTSRH